LSAAGSAATHRPGPAVWPAWRDGLLAATLGTLHSLAFVDTWLWGLNLVTVAVLAWRVGAATPARAGLLGLVFGTAWLACGTWWLFISMHRYGGLPAWLAALAVALLCAGMALLLAAALAAFARWRRGPAWLRALQFGAWWLLAELARGVLFTGFPWVAHGYAFVDSPFAALAPWVGVYGIGVLAAALAAAPGLGAGGWRRRGTAVLVAVAVPAALAVTPRADFTQPSGSLSVALLQGNVPQNEKFSLEHLPAALEWTRARLLEANADLVVGPETVVPLLPQQLDPRWWEPVLEHFRAPGRAALIGLPLGDEILGYTNSVAGISAATASRATWADGFYRYDKHHLVPFGEVIPFGFKWFVRMMDIPLGDFNRGALVAPSFGVRGERIGPNVCYEDLFGEELAARFADAAGAPTILSNVSNIGWFGPTSAVNQHLNISRMRTLELQRPMLRATNTGATVVIDHRGRVTHALPPFTQGVLEGRVEGRTGITPFARWAGSAGLWPLFGLALVVCGASIRRRTERPAEAAP
jgi:apolipoprotein N-acyltransferase